MTIPKRINVNIPSLFMEEIKSIAKLENKSITQIFEEIISTQIGKIAQIYSRLNESELPTPKGVDFP